MKIINRILQENDRILESQIEKYNSSYISNELNIIDSVLIDIKYINKKYKYPQIIPIVLYTGKEKWNAKTDLRSAQYKWNKYRGQELSRYNILDINKISDEELLDEESIISKILLIEKSRTEQKY